MDIELKEQFWVIASMDEEWIVKGSFQNKFLVRLDNKEDNKALVIYPKKELAERAITESGFYNEFAYFREKFPETAKKEYITQAFRTKAFKVVLVEIKIKF